MIHVKQRVFRMTPQRLAILECLSGNRDHPSAEDIFKTVREKYPSISFATVYNNLEALRESGAIRRLMIDPERMRYDPDTSYHHHFICMDCSRVFDVHVHIRPRISKGQKSGFEVTDDHVEFYGRCPDCKKVRGKIRSEARAAY